MVETRCPQCGTDLPADSPAGVCPVCVLQLAGSEGAGSNPTSAYPGMPTLPTLTELQALFPQLEILELIGRGGMGAVYKARQPSLDRFVALKILLPDIGKDPTFAERFSREARALAKLNHPHIVSVYDSGHVGGLYYFLMEYVDGVNLRQAIQAEQISPEKALAIVPQICDALQYAHEEGVVHRDIKPENVLLDRKGRVKVADFGLAKLLGLATPDITLTGTRQAMGTLHYMAPEQYERPQAVDHRADIYSLGVVFYELLTGKLPLGRFALPSEKASVDVRLDNVVLKTLEREPERRYQYVSEVKTDVDNIAHAPPVITPLMRAAVKPELPPGSHARREFSDVGRFLLFLGILCLAMLPLMCLGSVAFYFFSSSAASFRIIPVFVVVGGLLLLVASVVLIAVGLSQRRPVASAAPAGKLDPRLSTTRVDVKWIVGLPAIAMLIVALIHLTMGAFLTLLIFGERSGEVGSVLLVSLLLIGTSTVMGLGAVRMRQLRSYPLAMLAAILAVLPFSWPLGLPVGIWALAVLCRSDVRRAFGVDGASAATGQPSGAGPVVAVVLVIVAAVVALPLLLAVGLLLSWTTVRVAPGPTTTFETFPQTESPKVDATVIHWTNNGPMLGQGATVFGYLGPGQEHAVQTALTEVYADYLKLEQANTKHSTNPAGHQIVTISPFDLTGLENQFWTKVDEVVTDDTQRRALRGQLTSKILFPFGHERVSYEFWKVGAWYHYADAYNHFDGPELPPRLARFWRPPLEEGRTNETAPDDQ